MSSLPKYPNKFSRRQLRGLAIVARGQQIIKVNDSYKVKSQNSDRTYSVVWAAKKWTCNCPDYSGKLRPCKHVHAVIFMLQLPDIVKSNSILFTSPPNADEQAPVDG
jgi:hypothetical protein